MSQVHRCSERRSTPDRLFLQDGPDAPPILEALPAADQAEAPALGEMRLLLTSSCTHAILALDGMVVGTLKRDSHPDLVDLVRQ